MKSQELDIDVLHKYGNGEDSNHRLLYTISLSLPFLAVSQLDKS